MKHFDEALEAFLNLHALLKDGLIQGYSIELTQTGVKATVQPNFTVPFMKMDFTLTNNPTAVDVEVK